MRVVAPLLEFMLMVEPSYQHHCNANLQYAVVTAGCVLPHSVACGVVVARVSSNQHER